MAPVYIHYICLKGHVYQLTHKVLLCSPWLSHLEHAWIIHMYFFHNCTFRGTTIHILSAQARTRQPQHVISFPDVLKSSFTYLQMPRIIKCRSSTDAYLFAYVCFLSTCYALYSKKFMWKKGIWWCVINTHELMNPTPPKFTTPFYPLSLLWINLKSVAKGWDYSTEYDRYLCTCTYSYLFPALLSHTHTHTHTDKTHIYIQCGVRTCVRTWTTHMCLWSSGAKMLVHIYVQGSIGSHSTPISI